MSAVLVEALRRALAGHSGVRFAMLFGSVARGTANRESDVDLAVSAPAVDHLALARDLSQTLGREVHVVDLGGIGYPMLQAILRDGIVVAEHARGAVGRWRAHALIELETDRPWFERMRDAYLARLAAAGRSS